MSHRKTRTKAKFARAKQRVNKPANLSFLLFAYQPSLNAQASKTSKRGGLVDLITNILNKRRIYIQRTAPQAVPQAPPQQQGLGGADPHTLNLQQALQGIQQTVQQLSGLAQAFSKAGPMATTAVLCILFALISLLSSGVIKVEI